MTRPEPPRCQKTGKIRFPSSGAAMQEVKRAQGVRAQGWFKNGKEGRVEQRSYPCMSCGGHHLTAMTEAPSVEFEAARKPSQRKRR